MKILHSKEIYQYIIGIICENVTTGSTESPLKLSIKSPIAKL